MEPETYFGKFYKVAGFWIPDYAYCGQPAEDEMSGYGARFQMPGYLDATDWEVFETEEEAENWIAEELNEEEEND